MLNTRMFWSGQSVPLRLRIGNPYQFTSSLQHLWLKSFELWRSGNDTSTRGSGDGDGHRAVAAAATTSTRATVATSTRGCGSDDDIDSRLRQRRHQHRLIFIDVIVHLNY